MSVPERTSLLFGLCLFIVSVLREQAAGAPQLYRLSPGRASNGKEQSVSLLLTLQKRTTYILCIDSILYDVLDTLQHCFI